jgi:TolA-binding protein
MTCIEARATFSDLYDGALTGASLAALNHHLEACAACRAEWTSFQRTTQAVTALGGAEPSPGFAARVRQRVGEPPWWRWVIQWLFVPLRVKLPIQAVALVLLAFAGILFYQRSPELRREVEPSRTVPPVTHEVPVPKPSLTPPATEAPEGRLPPPARRQGPKDERAERQAPPVGAAPPPPQTPLQGQKGGSPWVLRDEAKKELGREATPPESPKVAEPSQESRAKAQEPAPGARGLMRSAPAPLSPAPPSPAPASEARISSVPSGSADQLYSSALADLNSQGYDRAIDSLRAFIREYPRDGRVPVARMRLADAYVAQQRYKDAIPEYEAVTRDFPDSPLVPSARYRHAQALLALGDQAGCQILRDVVDRYPQAPEAAPARETLSSRCR